MRILLTSFILFLSCTKELKNEINSLNNVIDSMRIEIDSLNNNLSNLQLNEYELNQIISDFDISKFGKSKPKFDKNELRGLNSKLFKLLDFSDISNQLKKWL